MQTRVRSTFIVVLAAVVVGAGLSAAPAGATYPGKNGKIVFVRYTDLDNGEIHTVNPDGTGEQRVSNYDSVGQDNAADFTPTWSRDGRKLAFRTSGGHFDGIVVMNPDGSGRRNVGPWGWAPAWSPDTTQLTFGAYDLYKVNTDGTALTTLSATPDQEFSSSWSPDGRIAFERQGLNEGYIWIMNSDGSGLVRTEGGGGGVDWSPDGSKIAFFNAGVSVMDADGTDPRILFNAYQFDWSPDGRKLVLAVQKLGAPRATNHIYSVNPDGSDLTELKGGGDLVGYPTWSPDGSKIAYVEESGIFTMNPDGSGTIRLTDRPGLDLDWQPLSGPKRSDYKNASAYCAALRDFLGGADFSERYKNHGKCVSQNH